MSVKMMRYSKAHGDYIIDAVCECGHLEREHGSLTKKVDSKLARMPQGGSCCEQNCECLQFTWARWMTLSEYNAKLEGNCVLQ